jgi:hypothetical protein
MNGLLGEIPNNGRSAEETFANRFFVKQAMIRWKNITVTTKEANGIFSSVSIQSLVAQLGFPMSHNDDDDFEQEQIGQTTLKVLCQWSNTRTHQPVHLVCSSSATYLLFIRHKHGQKQPACDPITCIFCKFFGDEQPENKGASLVAYAEANNNINNTPLTISLFEKPTLSSMLKSPAMKSPFNLNTLPRNRSLFYRNRQSQADERNDWSVEKLRIAIEMRLNVFARQDVGIDQFSRNDQEFEMMNIAYENVTVFKSYMVASNERVDSKLWSKESRANVLVVCPWRDQYVTNEIHDRPHLSDTDRMWRASNFPIAPIGPANFLHPAIVHCFIAVRYDVVSKQYLRDHPNCSDFHLWSHEQESQMETLTAVFALCDFYKANINRQSHVYGGLAELWTSEFDNLPFENESITSQLQLASCLVPVNRLAGKFLPGILRDDDILAHNMLVLRLPIRL